MSDSVRFGFSYGKQCLRAILLAVVLSVVMVLLSAALIRLFSINLQNIGIFNVVIKISAALLSVLISFRMPDKGWLCGVIAGTAFALIAGVAFRLFAGNGVEIVPLIADVALGAVSGAVGGVLAVNLKKSAG